MSIYGAEQRVYLAALASPCRTLAPEAADFFFVPVFSSIPVHAGLYQEEGAVANLTAGHDLLELARAALLAASPAYRADPSRHVFTVSHDIGSCLAPLSLLGSVFLQHFGNALSNREVLLYLENATDPRLLARARAAPCFDAAKDIVIPPFIGERDSFAVDEVAGLRHGGAGNFDRRADHAVYFRGSVHQHPSYSSGVRQALCSSLSSSLPNSSLSCSLLPSASAYWRELSAAAYCPSPGGWVGWSPRTYQAIAAGCAPVLFLGEGERLPFRDVVDWAEFAVLLPAGPANGTARNVTAELRAVLDAETGEDLARRRKAMAGAWRSFTYGRDPRRTGMREAHRLVALVEYEGGGAGRRTTAVVESGGRGGAFELVLEELGRRL